MYIPGNGSNGVTGPDSAHMDKSIFEKNTSNIPGDNGSSLNVLITIKIIALANIIVIETSVLALYLLVHYLILIFLSYAPLPGDSIFACYPCTSS